MAIYDFTVDNLSRGRPKDDSKQNATKGNESNAVATVAYMTALVLTCERTGKTHKYGHPERVVYQETLLPEGAPKEWEDPEKLWNAVENYETNIRARLAKKLFGAFPNELTLEQEIEIAQTIAKALIAMGFGVTFGIHHTVEPGKPKNDHLHLLCTDRAISKEGKWLPKQKKEYDLDEDGNRIPIEDKITHKQKVDAHGRKQWKRHTTLSNPLDSDEFVNTWRERWENLCNEYLDEDHKISRLSYEDRGIDKISTIHEGWGKYEAKSRKDYNEQVKAKNEEKEKAEKDAFNATKEIDKIVAANPDLTESEIDDPDLWAIVRHHIAHAFDPNYDYINDLPAITHIVTDNPLVVDIQCLYIKSVETDKVTIDGLKAMAETVLWLQKHDCLGKESFAHEKAKITADVEKEKQKLADIKAELNDTNMAIHYLITYYKGKKNPSMQGEEYKTAVSVLRKLYPNGFPNKKTLDKKKKVLLDARDNQKKVIKEAEKSAYKFGIIEHNLNAALGIEEPEKKAIRKTLEKPVKKEINEPVPVRKVAEQEQPVNTTRTAPPVRKEPTVVEPTIVNPAPAQPEPVQTQEPVMPSYYDYGQYNNYASAQEPPRVQVPQSKQPPVPVHEDVIHVLVAMDGYKPREIDIYNDLNSVFEQIGNNVDYDFHDDGTVVIWSKDQSDLCLVAKYTDTDDGGVDLGSLSPEQVQDYIYALRGDQDDLDYDNDELSYDNEQPHDRDGPEL